jgi:glycosyl transferase family 2
MNEDDAPLPSFSLIIETENLANADLGGLSLALASIDRQEIRPESANEVLIVDSGDLPADRLAELRRRHGWLRVHQAPAATSYYQAKMLAAGLATGEIVVFCDSDCVYEPGWLRHILRPFQASDVDVVAGETRTGGDGLYGAAMGLTYIFPPFSGEVELQPTARYFLNNVAFRRSFLLGHPFPTGLGLYRGDCAIHAQRLRRQGHRIWLQPLARASHAPPNGLDHFFWRFLIIGHDMRRQNGILAETGDPEAERAGREAILGQATKTGVFVDRLRRLMAGDRRRALLLLPATPIIAAAVTLILAGYLISVARPGYLAARYERRLASAGGGARRLPQASSQSG